MLLHIYLQVHQSTPLRPPCQNKGPAVSAWRRRAGQRGLAGGPPAAPDDVLNSTLAQLLMVMERLDERIGARPDSGIGYRVTWYRFTEYTEYRV